MTSCLVAFHRHTKTVQELGKCKSWTVDSELDRGLDYELIFGLDYGLSLALVMTISNHIYQHIAQCGALTMYQ